MGGQGLLLGGNPALGLQQPRGGYLVLSVVLQPLGRGCSGLSCVAGRGQPLRLLADGRLNRAAYDGHQPRVQRPVVGRRCNIDFLSCLKAGDSRGRPRGFPASQPIAYGLPRQVSHQLHRLSPNVLRPRCSSPRCDPGRAGCGRRGTSNSLTRDARTTQALARKC